MKVNGSDPLSRLRDLLRRIDESDRTQAEKADRSSRSGSPADGPASSDSIQLSVRAQEIQRLREAIEKSPDLRQELVDRVRDEIASGQYRIDGTRIAASLLEEDSIL